LEFKKHIGSSFLPICFRTGGLALIRHLGTRGRKRMSKEKQKRRNQRGAANGNGKKVATIVISVVVFLAIAALAIWNSGIIQKSKTAVTVAGKNYSTGVVQFYYRSAYNQFLNTYGDYASMFGLDTSKPLDQQEYGEDGKTWADYFKDMGIDNMERAIILSSEARKANISLSEESQAYLQQTKDELTVYCVNNNITKGTYFASLGTGVTEKLYFEQLENMLLADDYAKHLTEQMQYSEDEITAYYDGHKNDFDIVSYRYFYFGGTPEAKTDAEENEVKATEEETKAAMEQASKLANEMANKVKAGKDFTALTQEYAVEGEKETYQDSSASTATDVSKSAVSNTAYQEWAFSPDRTAGDVTVSEEADGYYVLQFLSRGRNDYETMNIRQISLSPAAMEGTDTVTDEQKAATKTKAENILAQWEQGDKTEDSFAALAKEQSDDENTKEDGGLYQQANKDTLSAEVSEWVFAEGRKAGDTTVVATESGACYIVYIMGPDQVYWKLQVKSAMQTAEYEKWYENVKKEYPLERNESGLKYVK
jgi:hypothetical protein